MTFEQILALISALGLGGAATALVKGAREQISGRAIREKTHNQDLVVQRDRAWELVEAERKRADLEIAEAIGRAVAAETSAREALALKRKALEQSSRYRRQIIEMGGTPEPWPPELR